MPDSTLSPGSAGVARDRNRGTSGPKAGAPHGAVARAQRVGRRWRDMQWVDFTSEPESGSVAAPAPDIAPPPAAKAAVARPELPAAEMPRDDSGRDAALGAALGAALRQFAGPSAAARQHSAAIPGLKSRFTRLPVPRLALAPILPAPAPETPPVPQQAEAAAPPAAAPPQLAPPPPPMPRTGSVVVHPRTPAGAIEPPPLRAPLQEPPPRFDAATFPAAISTPVAAAPVEAAEPGGGWRAGLSARAVAAGAAMKSAGGGIAATAGRRLGQARLSLPRPALLPRAAVVQRAAAIARHQAILRHPAVDRLRTYLAAKENRLRVSGLVALSLVGIALAAYLGGAVLARALGPGTSATGTAVAPPPPAPDTVTKQLGLADKVVHPPQTAEVIPPAPGIPPGDPAARAGFYMARAKAGDAAAQYDLGVLYARGDGLVQDFDSAATWFHAAAAQGNVSAEYNLGVLYEQGLGVAGSKAEALNWYRSAADQNHPGAQFNLALAYAQGDGAKQDFAAAARWYKRAARQGLGPAMVNLAICYETGSGVDRSPVDAYAWYSAAGERGDAAAKQRAGELFRTFNDRDKARAEGLAATIGAALDQQKPPA